MSQDAAYPELKKSHTMARQGRPWRDYKPPPSGPVWAAIQAGNTYWSLVAAVDLGVFDALGEKAPVAAAELADDLGVSAPHLQHLLDCMVTLGFLEQLNNEYELTETAERYLCRDGAASMADLVRISPGPLENWMNLAQTIRQGVVAEPIENDPGAFYRPLVRATFATQYRVATRLGAALGWARMPGLKVLDLGAGGAPWSIAVLDQSEKSTAVINDLPEVIPEAEAQIVERKLSDRVKFSVGDFHEVDFADEAFDLVVLGHVCRTEGPEFAKALIAKAAGCLRPGGRLVVADYFADNERKLNAFGVQMGLTMLANTRRGQILTHEQVVGWLTEQPLEAVRLLEPIGFNLVYVATKI